METQFGTSTPGTSTPGQIGPELWEGIEPSLGRGKVVAFGPIHALGSQRFAHRVGYGDTTRRRSDNRKLVDHRANFRILANQPAQSHAEAVEPQALGFVGARDGFAPVRAAFVARLAGRPPWA